MPRWRRNVEMIERVARAIDPLAWVTDGLGNLVFSRSLDRAEAMCKARAAIEAMREPTEAMIQDMHDGPLGAFGEVQTAESKEWLREMWHTAITAALTPDKAG